MKMVEDRTSEVYRIQVGEVFKEYIRDFAASWATCRTEDDRVLNDTFCHNWIEDSLRKRKIYTPSNEQNMRQYYEKKKKESARLAASSS